MIGNYPSATVSELAMRFAPSSAEAQVLNAYINAGYGNTIASNVIRGNIAFAQTDVETLTEEEQWAIRAYKAGDSYKINAKLLYGAELDEYFTKLRNGMDSALPKLPIYRGTVYRTLGFDDFGGKEAMNEFVEQHQINTPIHYGAYSSCSRSETGHPIEGENVVTLVIDSITGRDLEGIGNNSEQEVLFGRDAVFITKELSIDEKGHTVIHLKEVAENGRVQQRTDDGHNRRNNKEQQGVSVETSQNNMQFVQESNSKQRSADMHEISRGHTEENNNRRAGVSGVYGEITEGSNNEEVHLRRGGERIDGENTGRPIRGLEGGTGRNQSGQTQSRPTARSTDSLTLGEKVSTASLGIAGGSNIKSIRLVTGGERVDITLAKQLAKKRGLRAVFFAGDNLHIKEGKENIDARAYISGDRVFVRVDHPSFDAYQLLRHEVGHDMIDKGEIDLNDVRKRIKKELTKEKFAEISKMYAEAYAMNGYQMSPNEVFVEIVCDSLGDMNIFAGKLNETSAKEMLDQARGAVSSAQAEANTTRGPPVGVGTEGKFSRALRGRTIELETMENNRFQRLRQFGENLPSEWYAFTKDFFYIYSNHSYTDYTILAKVSITERNRTDIRWFMEELENGTIRSTETFNSWASHFRRGKGSNSWHRVGTGNSRTAGRYDGVDVRKRGSNNSTNTKKDSRTNQVTEEGPPVGVGTDGKFSRDLIGKTFPPYNVSRSDANEQATRWAHRDDVIAGDRAIVFYHNNPYLIEKYDSAELGYQIEKILTVKQYKELVQELGLYEEISKRDSVESCVSEVDKLNSTRSVDDGREHSSNSLSSGYGGTRSQVQRVGEVEAGRGQTDGDGSGSVSRSSTDSSRNRVVEGNQPVGVGAAGKFSREVNGNQVVWIEENILKENKGKPIHQFIADFIAEHIGDVYTIIESGQKVYIGEDLPSEYTQSKYTQSVLRNNPNLIKAKNKAVSKIGEIIEIATNRKWEKTEHTENKDAKYGMYRYDSRFGFPVKNSKKEIVGANIYNVQLVIRNASDGKKYLYDIVGIKKDTVSSDWLSKKIASATEKTVGQKNNVSNNSIPNSDKNVNGKASLDIEAPNATDEQIDFVSEMQSSVRDVVREELDRMGKADREKFDTQLRNFSILNKTIDFWIFLCYNG